MAPGPTLQVLDGHESIGGTKILLDAGAHKVLLDFGTNYKRLSRFYAEFLRPRSARGVTDFVVHGLLPRLRGAYRPGLFPADEFPTGDAEFEGAAPTAVLLTHAHLDHCGAISFLRPEIPVYSSPTTLALLRAWQEAANPDPTNEVVYYSERAADARGVVRGTERGTKHRRAWRILGEATGALTTALEASPSSRGTLEGPSAADGRSDPVLRELGVRWMAVDHSLMGAAAFLLDVDGARIGYTGDVRFHGERGADTEAFLRELERRAPDVLLVEGTRLEAADAPEHGGRTTEEEVRRRATATLREYAGRFAVADFGPRNIERLRMFRDVADTLGRQLVVTDRDAHTLRLLATTERNIPTDFAPGALRIWEEPSAARGHAWQQAVDSAWADAKIRRDEVEANPGRWLFCFSYLDVNDLIDLRRATRGGVWLYSASEAHGEEQEFDFQRLKNWIEWAGMRPVGFQIDPASGRPVFEPGYHASGHATQAELLELVRRASPRAIVPVHAEMPHRYAELLAPEQVRVVLPRPDVPLEISRIGTGAIS